MIRILHLSDPHFGAADPAAAAAFLEQTAALPRDLTVLSGDLTMRARRSELAEARRFVEGLPQPLLMIPGNHDIPACNQLFHRFFAPFRRYRSTFGRDIEPEHAASGFHVVAINSNKAYGLYPDWSVGRLSVKELRRAESRLASCSDSALRALVLHHPLLAPEDHRRDVVQPLGKLLDLIDRRRVDVVLCGHFHCSNLAAIGPRNGWHCVVSQAATVCSTRLQGEPQGFHHIEITASQITIDRYVYRNLSFHQEGVFTFIRNAQGWQSADAPTLRESSHIA